MKRSSERGSAMLVTMLLVTALLGGAAVLASIQTDSTKSAGITRSKISALYCAEAGITTVRRTVANNYALWNATLGQSTEPSWLAGVNHDIDGDGVADFRVTLRDNADDNDLQHDNDLSVFIVSTCTKYGDTTTEVNELVRFNGGGNCYEAQLGGCGGNANAN